MGGQNDGCIFFYFHCMVKTLAMIGLMMVRKVEEDDDNKKGRKGRERKEKGAWE